MARDPSLTSLLTGRVHSLVADGRRVVVHYHHGGDTSAIDTLKRILEATWWADEDFWRLGLVK